MPSNLDLDRIKAARMESWLRRKAAEGSRDGFYCGGIDNAPMDVQAAFWAVAEVERLRQELATAKSVGPVSGVKVERQNAKKPKPDPIYAAFIEWWRKDGLYIDPDPEVDWYDKRRDLAWEAYRAAAIIAVADAVEKEGGK